MVWVHTPMRETMPERRPGDSQLVEFDDGATPVDSLDVLYLDADADIREATRRAVEARRDVIAVASVASVEAALEVATDETDCLVIDPVGLEGSADRLLDRFDCPVIYYTTLDAAAFDDDLLAGTSTIVEKTPRRFAASSSPRKSSASPVQTLTEKNKR
ncbi:hypothetical protein ACFQH8_09230 [Halomicroarcula sp. GCM10025710]